VFSDKFGIWLNIYTNTSQDVSGELSLGESNSARYTGSLNYHNILPPYDQWIILIDE